MTNDDDILSELRTIRQLLTLEKENRLEEMVGGLSDIQQDVINELKYVEWERGFSEEIADAHDVSKRQVQRETKDLVEKNLIKRKGAASGTEYRKSALFRAADLANKL